MRALATIPIAAAHAREVRTLGIDHVHAHFASYPALAAWFCWRLTGVPYSVTAHAHDLFMSQVFLRRKLADARVFVTVSEHNRHFIAAVTDGNQTPIQVIRAGLDPHAYRFRVREPSAHGPLEALCVGALKEYKGQHVLLRALALGGPHVSRMQLRLVGDGPLRAALEKSARELGISERVSFLGAVPEQAVVEHLDHADVFVMPSVVARSGQKDGIPVALMEALAAGLPAVATRQSGVPELIRDGETGYLAEPGDVEGLRDALERALADPAAIRTRAEAGRKKVEAEFDLSHSAEALWRLFRESTDQAEPT